jgi:Putative Flp pilus-assembly TadE/G-like
MERDRVAGTKRLGERGVTLVVMALMLSLALGMSALAIDYGMIKSATAEAQRAMDAAALAGASAFVGSQPAGFSFDSAARSRAKYYAGKHQVHRIFVNPDPPPAGNLTVDVDLAAQKVTATYSGNNIPLLFAKTFGTNTMTVRALAAAHVEATNTATCVKPVALPDQWDNRTTALKKGSEDPNGDHIWNYDDKNKNGVWDEGEAEQWAFNGSDVYDSTSNGLGTSFRDSYGTGSNIKTKDFGRQILVASFSSKDGTVPSFYLTWGNKPEDNNVPDIQTRILSGCDPVDLSKKYSASNGAKVPTGQAWDDLIAKDAGATWDDVHNKIIPSAQFPDPNSSPRVVIVGLYHPGLYNSCSACNDFQFNNLAKIFLEKRPCTGNGECKQPLTGRFLGFAEGGGPSGQPVGTLVKHLVLIK